MTSRLNFSWDDFAVLYLELCAYFAGVTATNIPSSISSSSSYRWSRMLESMEAWNNKFEPSFTSFFNSLVKVWNNQISGNLNAYSALKDAFLADINNKKILDDLINNVSIMNGYFVNLSTDANSMIGNYDYLNSLMPHPAASELSDNNNPFVTQKKIIDYLASLKGAKFFDTATPVTIGLVTFDVQTTFGNILINTGVVGLTESIAQTVASDPLVVQNTDALNNFSKQVDLSNHSMLFIFTVFDWLAVYYNSGLWTPPLNLVVLNDVITTFRQMLVDVLNVINDVVNNISNVKTKLLNYKINPVPFNFDDEINIGEITALTYSDWGILLQSAESVNKLNINYNLNPVKVN